MFTMLFEKNNAQKDRESREGELYRKVTTFGKTFELRYGYYEEQDRLNPLCEPVPIYPDLFKAPIYTEDGRPFVTMMQDTCEHYEGEMEKTLDIGCSDCKYFVRGEEWFGICTCSKRKINGGNIE